MHIIDRSAGAGRPAPRLGVYIGRFQPFHLGHLHVVRQALQACDRLLILIGSADEPRSTRNPWTAPERDAMIRAGLPGNMPDVVDTSTIRDWSTNAVWVAGVRSEVAKHLVSLGWEAADVLICGHAKDHTSHYLKWFPEWSSIAVDNYAGLSATELREEFFLDETALDPRDVPLAVSDWLEDTWLPANEATAGFLYREFVEVERYRSRWGKAPYEPTFITTDALVVSAGHVALIQRGKFPGRGLRALPGGFLESDQTLLGNALKEFGEECEDREGAPAEWLRPYLREVRVFDAPGRDPRGRFVTHVHLFVLPDEFARPVLVGRDDAEWAGWVPLDRISRSEMAFDHFQIIKAMTPGLELPLTLKEAA